jgi:outer membrane protein TolC
MNARQGMIVLLLFLTFQYQTGVAQELYTLDQILEIAYENSPDILESKLDLEQSRESLNAERAGLKSLFYLDVSPLTYSHDREFDEFESIWYTNESMESSGTFNVVQPIKATDGEISLSNTFSWQDTYNDYSDVSTKTLSNNIQLTLDQPIFTYNQTKMDLRELELDLEDALLSYALQKLSVEKSVSQYFYDVYQEQQSLIISKDELDNQQKSYEVIKNKVDAGLTAREEFWQAELNLANARSDVYNAEVSLESAKDQLKQAIGMDLNKEIGVLADVEVKTIDVQLQDAIDYALTQRMELRQRQIDIETAQFDLITANATNEFQGNISLSVGLFGDIKKLQNIYDSPTNNQEIALTLEIPLWDWGEKRSTVKAAEAYVKVQELYLEDERISIEMNLREVFRDLNNQVNQIEIAQKSVENAQLTYELNLEKYKNGDLTSMDLSLYQNQLSTQKNSLTSALIDYKLELLNLKIQTLWDFEAHQSIVPSVYSSEFENK